MRKHPRFTTHQEVGLEVEGRNELRPCGSRTSPRAASSWPLRSPRRRAPVKVEIDTPEGMDQMK